MKNTLPKLLQDALDGNSVDVKIITETLKMPWLKLDLKFPTIAENQIESLTKVIDWRKGWGVPSENYTESNYQIKEWNGQILFGPKQFNEFLIESTKTKQFQDKIDEDSKCKFFRDKFDYDWYINDDNIIRNFISELLPDDDINLINTYILSPGGYVFPHRDFPFDNIGLAKIYIAAIWEPGNIFGVYGCGNIPINQGDVFLINNYTLPHWVYNGSDATRFIIDIGANLNSPKIKQLIEDSFTERFNVKT